MKKSLDRFYPFIIFLFAVLLYANTIPNGYNMDDELVTINHRTTSKGFDGISEIFSGFYYEDEMGYKYGYRPITQLTFAIEHQFFGESPHTSHAINVLLYGILCVCIFILVNKLDPIRGPTLALIVALIFAVHPIHTEVVASIKNRDEILSLLFGLCAWIWVFKALKKQPLFRSILNMLVAASFYFLAINAKISTTLFLLFIPIFFRLINSFNWRVLIFVFVGGGAMSYRFLDNIKALQLSKTSIILILVFVILSVISNFVNTNKLAVRIKDLFLSKTSAFLLLPISYLIMAVGVYMGESVFLTISLVLAQVYLFIHIRYKEDNFKLFAVIFPLMLFTCHLYNLPFLVFPYITLYVFYSPVKDSKTIFKELLFFGAFSLAVVWQKNVLVGFAIIPLLFSFSKRFEKFCLALWLILTSVLLSIESQYLLIVNILFLILLLPRLSNHISHFKWVQMIKPRYYSFILLFFILHYHITLSEYDHLKQFALQETEYIADQTFEIFDDFKSSDRPVLYVENPIIENWDYEHRLALALNTNMFYIGKLLFPYPLSYYYGYDQIKIYDFKDWQTLVSFAILLIIVSLCVYLFLRGNYLMLLAILLIELSILPYSNLYTPVAGIVGERLAFTASFGFCLFIGILAYQIWQTKKYVWLQYSCALSMMALSFAFVLNRNTAWKDQLTLFQYDIENVVNSAQAHAMLAYSILESTKNDNQKQISEKALNEATLHFKQAVDIYPDFFNWHFDLGKLYFSRQEYLKSKLSFEKAAKIDKAYIKTYTYLLDIANIDANVNEVKKYCQILLDQDPSNVNLLLNYSAALYYSGNFNEALRVNNQVIALNPTIAEAYLNKAYSLLKLGDKLKAELALAKGKSLNPNAEDISKLEDLMKFD